MISPIGVPSKLERKMIDVLTPVVIVGVLGFSLFGKQLVSHGQSLCENRAPVSCLIPSDDEQCQPRKLQQSPTGRQRQLNALLGLGQ